MQIYVLGDAILLVRLQQPARLGLQLKRVTLFLVSNSAIIFGIEIRGYPPW